MQFEPRGLDGDKNGDDENSVSYRTASLNNRKSHNICRALSLEAPARAKSALLETCW